MASRETVEGRLFSCLALASLVRNHAKRFRRNEESLVSGRRSHVNDALMSSGSMQSLALQLPSTCPQASKLSSICFQISRQMMGHLSCIARDGS